MSDQRCGTCRWWSLIRGLRISGYCRYPLPFFMPPNIDPQTMIDDGIHCKVYSTPLATLTLPTSGRCCTGEVPATKMDIRKTEP